MSKSQYDVVAEEYEKQRPEYPEELIESLIGSTGVNVNSRLLEVGAGTGKATMALAQKGYKIDCIEIEPKMAEILLNKIQPYPNISVTIDNFETWEEEHKKYDLIFSAQAFHWIDEGIKYKKCHNLLKDEGHLALFWYISVIESIEMSQALNSIFKKYNADFGCTGIDGYESFLKREREKLEKTELFTNIREVNFNSVVTDQSAGLFVERFNTTSAFASLDEKVKLLINAELTDTINSLGGNVAFRLIYFLLLSDKARFEKPLIRRSCS